MTKHRKAYPQIGPGTKSPSYLLLKNGTWYFRYVLPQGIQNMLGGIKELKISLGPGMMREAKSMSGRLAGNIYQACSAFYLHQARLTEFGADRLRTFLKEAVCNGVEHSTLGTLTTSAGTGMLATPLRPSTARISPQRHTPPVLTPVVPTLHTGPNLREAVDAYCSDKERIGAWTERTRKDFTPKLHFFLEQTGNIPVSSLTRDHIRQFKDIIDKLPSRYGVTSEFKNVDIKTIMQGVIPLDKRMTPSSLGKYYGVINSFLIWMETNYENIQSGMEKILTIKINTQADLLRNVFTDTDIKLLFSSQEYKSNSFNAEYKYWIPLIGYYTGMRIEEICQLTVHDIKRDNDIFYFDVNNDDEKTVKTQASLRKIPVHPVLSDKLKFIHFIEEQKAKNHVRLFPTLKPSSGRYSHYVSRWFNENYLVKIGVKSDSETGKVFHSFRHTFANSCKISGVDEYKAREILGHEVSSKSITYGRYGKKYPLDILFTDVIKKINLPDVSTYILE
jgi:integrase